MLSWSNAAVYIDECVPFREPMGNRGALLVFGGSKDRMEIHLPCEEAELPPKNSFAHLSADKRKVSGKFFMVLAGHGLSNLQPMHHLAVLCSTFFETHGTSASDAIHSGLNAWSQLLEGKPLLSTEEQLGLRGELALLRTLVVQRGPSAVSAWTAYDEAVSGRHDFRLDTCEIEVKSTRGSSRRHWVSSMQQLVPSPGLNLFLLSLRFEPAGLAPGMTLPEVVEALRSSLLTHPKDRTRFERLLVLARYRDEDAQHYDDRLHLAAEPVLVPVDGNLPALTTGALSNCIAPHALSRLIDLRYQIDCDGLGSGPEGAAFQQHIGLWAN